MKVVYDFHGYRPHQAEMEIEDLIYNRDRSEDYEVEAITGNGVIRSTIADLLDCVGVEWTSDGPNLGKISFRLYKEKK